MSAHQVSKSNAKARRTIAGMLVVACCASWLGKATEFTSRLWQMEDGLPHNIVQALCQTSDGYLWVGTREGLARFDGMHFKNVELSGESPHSSVLSLVESSDKALWVGTEGQGLYRIAGGSIQRMTTTNANQKFSVYDLLATGSSVWIASSRGVLEWTGKEMQQRCPFKNLVQCLCLDSHGSVWLAGQGLSRLSATPTNYVVTSGPPIGNARKVYCDADDTFWIASGTSFLEVCRGVTTERSKADDPSGFICAMLRDHRQEFWIGTYSGLSRYQNGKFVNLTSPEEPSYQVYALLEDREGSVWVGSEEGLTRLTPRAFRTFTKRDGLSMNRVVTVCAGTGDDVWVGLHGGGINHFQDEHFETINKATGLSSDFVMAMCLGRDGSLWAGTDYGSMLNHIKGGRITILGPEQGFKTGTTTALVEESEGGLWIGTRDGLQYYRDGYFTNFTTRQGLSDNKINALAVGGDGALWIGTGNGLTRHQQSGFENISAERPELAAPILAVREDADGVLWLGTRGKGLLRMKGGAVRAFGSKEGLTSDSIYSVLEDRRGNLWLNGSRGIFRVSKQEIEAVASGLTESVQSIAYGKAEGILCSGQYGEVTQPAGCESRDGRLWFRTTQGVAVVDPNKITTNQQPPPVVIEEVVADRKSIAERKLLEPIANVRAPKGRGELEVRYSALSLCAPEKDRFRYRLRGADPDWVDAGARRTAYYSKVAPGKYTFEVTACNNDGVWATSPALLTIQVEPHFWQTHLFLVGCILGAAGFIAIAVRYATRRRMRRELQKLEQQNAVERERARIARDIHDDIGTGLTEIALTSEMVEDPSVSGEEARQLAGEISDRARQLVTGMDEIVWAINPRNDTVKSAAAYFSQFAQRLLKAAGITCRLDIEQSLPELALSSEQRHNLFLSFKEALNNLAKHSNATEAKVSISLNDSMFTVTVQDNGGGFDPREQTAAADGLLNMRERMTRLGGECDINTANGRGTTLRLILPLQRAVARP
jgi:ligand-binding sensor domain-containing protein/signal transduction histidine kinase